jgi:hypothetical protein
MRAVIINTTVTVIVEDETYFNSNVSKKDIDLLIKLIKEYRQTPNEKLKNDIINIVSPDVIEKQNKVKDLDERIKSVETNLNETTVVFSKLPFSDFFDVNKYGVVLRSENPTIKNVPLPKELTDNMVKAFKNGEDILPYVKFWQLILNNPNKTSRQGAFKFIQKQKLIITPNGYIVCYRRADVVDGEVDGRGKYIQSEILRLKTNKCSLSRYWLGTSVSGEFQTFDTRTKMYSQALSDGRIIDNFVNLREEIGKTNKIILTDNHTKKMRFTIGDVVSKPRRECHEDPNVECSNGLHIGSRNYISNNEWAGGVILLCLVNPMNIVSVPYADAHKMRVCEYKIIQSVGSVEELDELEKSDIKVFDDDYLNYELSKISQALLNKEFENERFDCDIKSLFEERQKLIRYITTDKSTLLK